MRSASPTGSLRTSGAARTGAARTGADPVPPSATLAHQLERDRLERRAHRVRLVMRALRERAAARDGADGPPPLPLRAAIEDFGRELAEIEQRLRRTAR